MYHQQNCQKDCLRFESDKLQVLELFVQNQQDLKFYFINVENLLLFFLVMFVLNFLTFYYLL